ncbi:MAG: ACP S-malonyltransferase [Eubacteriales bacterium]|nr:ACP S-malonyltransferase [Eubacteriales bacterium]MDD3882114.1 ACP S-malonyltransferase [Eubacteriales bacterium]MDD4513219.1 ACP S-malonyltransferase [Eubacteriales bacterium]
MPAFKTAFVLSGQGSQNTGMGKSLYEASKKAREVMDIADRVLPGLKELCFYGSKEELSRTVNTQPAVMTVDVMCALAVMEAGVKPDALAGFSLGELAALSVSGMLPFETALRLVVRRAELMDECAESSESTMAAVVKLSESDTALVAERFAAYPANFNCPGQIVVSLKRSEVSQFSSAVREMGGRAIPLSVSGGFHSPYMSPAAASFGKALSGVEFAKPQAAVYSNFTSDIYEFGSEAELLQKQIDHPIYWEKVVRRMSDSGVGAFIECGPGVTLSGLIKKTGVPARVLNVESAESLADALKALREA